MDNSLRSLPSTSNHSLNTAHRTGSKGATLAKRGGTTMPNKIYSRTGLTWLFLSASLLAADSAGAQAVKVKLGSSLSPPALHVLAPYVALERGLFKKQGLDVEIVEIAGDPNHTKALLAVELDAAVIIGGTSVMVSASKGAK